ncbi:YcxB family protein [Erythrobacter sp. W53]|uniref:YcxB family protein n=1 Tax=Erythrobacter sp. W53 TaxID=3425947 RepID=UPI003D769E39
MSYPFTVTYTFEERDLIDAGRTHSFAMLRRWPFLVYIAVIVFGALAFIIAIEGMDNVLDGIIPFLIGIVGALVALILIGRFVVLPIFERRQFKQNVAMQDEQTATIEEERFMLESPRGTSVYRWEEFHRWNENKVQFMLYLTSRMYFMVPKRVLSAEQEGAIRNAIERSGLKRF